MDAQMLTIRLLGSIEILQGEKVININRRIERFILYILAVEHQPVSRTILIDMLWPQADQIDPRGALRTALSRLRKELPDPDMIVTELDAIRLDLNRCTIDILKFQDYYHSLQSPLSAYKNNRTLPAQIANQVREALTLWHGDNIIQGENLTSYPEIEIWRQSHNNQLTHQRKYLINRLAEHYQAAGQLELALEQYMTLGQLDILDVPVHLKILEILSQLGRNLDAIAYCDFLEATYEKEFNAPLPDVIIRKCRFAELEIDQNKVKGEKEWILPLTMHLPFVGRQVELTQLKQAFFSGGIVTLRGELGTGKTRLVQELLHTLGTSSTLFLASPREIEHNLPFSSIIHALRRYIPNDVWAELDSVWVDQLNLLMPELAELRTNGQKSVISNYPTGKQHLFEALFHLFQCLSEKTGKLIFFLDDGQWADTQTVQTISYLISKGFFDSKGLLLIAIRPEEPNQELEEMIDRFYRTHPIQTINLTGLNPENLRLLVENALQKKASTELIARIYQETSGNPFIALEIIRDLLNMDQDLGTLEDIPSLPLPESIRGIIRKRLNKLDETSRHILLCAAVLGNSFPPELLKSVSTLNKSIDINFLDPLIKSGFLSITDENNPSRLSVQFAHEKIREVILKEATASSLRILHNRVADHMVKMNQNPEKAVIIASHYHAGGDILNAFFWYIQAAQHAWNLGGKEDALKAYQQAEKLFREAANGFFTIDDILVLYEPWSHFAYQSNQSELMEQVGLKLQFLGEREKNPRLLGYSYIALANSCFLRMEMDTGSSLIEKAIDNLSHTTDRKALAQAILRQAAFCWWKLDYDCARQGAEQVLDLCDSLDIDEPETIDILFYARHTICMSYHAKGDAINTLQGANEAYKHYFHQLNPYNRMRTLNLLANAHELAGNYSLCERYVEECLEITRAIENSFVEELLLTIRAKALVIQGHLDEAYQDASKALAMGEKSGRNHTIIDASSVLGRIFFTLQNVSQALQHYRLAQIREGFPPKSLYGIENNIHLARVLSWQRQIPEARKIIENALALSREKGLQAHFTQALIVAAYCDLLEDKTASAREKFTQARKTALELGLKYEQVWSKKGLAHLELNQQHYEDAEKLLVETLDESQKYNFVWLHLNAWTHYIELMELTNQVNISDESRAKFHTVLNEMAKHTRSEPLRKDFEIAKKQWDKGILIP
jgi:DNA-binding SARP family transcriptional activator